LTIKRSLKARLITKKRRNTAGQRELHFNYALGGSQMAIYGLSVSVIQRSKGESATGAAAYRSGSHIVDARTGVVHDYRRKRGILSSTIIVPAGCPISRNRDNLWNAAEAAERRKDAGVAREYLLALPCELSPDRRRALALEFAKYLVVRHGVAVDVALHSPSRHGDERNFHVHVLSSMRALDKDGSFGERVAALASSKSGTGEVSTIRAAWEKMVNAALSEAGLAERVSHRSLEEQKAEALADFEKATTKSERHAALDRAARADRPPEPKRGARSIRRDRLVAREERGDLPVAVTNLSDKGMAVLACRDLRAAIDQHLSVQQSMRLAEKEVSNLKSQRIVCDANFIDRIIIHCRRSLRRLHVAGRVVTGGQLLKALENVRTRLRQSSGVVLPSSSFDILVRELTIYRDRLFSRPEAPHKDDPKRARNRRAHHESGAVASRNLESHRSI
jgi:hypothetical protein